MPADRFSCGYRAQVSGRFDRRPAAASRTASQGVGTGDADGLRFVTSNSRADMYKRYFVTTFGCQMNAHDSERIKGMLESLGIGEAPAPADPDVPSSIRARSARSPTRSWRPISARLRAQECGGRTSSFAVGGCYAEAQRDLIFERYPFVDVAFGPGSIPYLGEWIECGWICRSARWLRLPRHVRRDPADAP